MEGIHELFIAEVTFNQLFQVFLSPQSFCLFKIFYSFKVSRLSRNISIIFFQLDISIGSTFMPVSCIPRPD